MEREEVEIILKELHYSTNNELAENPENDSEYIIWTNNYEGVSVYLGNWFVESDMWSHAFPYKDPITTRKDLVKFFKGIKHEI